MEFPDSRGRIQNSGKGEVQLPGKCGILEYLGNTGMALEKLGFHFPGKQLYMETKKLEMWDPGMLCEIQKRIQRKWEFPSQESNPSWDCGILECSVKFRSGL